MRSAPRRQILKSDLVPVPIGMNTSDPAVALGPMDAAYLINLVHSDRGLKPRPGSAEWATGVGALAGAEVRTIIPYGGSLGAKDRLFACTTDGIWNCTAGGALANNTANRVLAFATADANSGYGNATVMTTAGGRFIAYADESNGFQLYTEATDAWAAGSVTGVSPSALTYVLQWKSRLWLVEGGTSHAWYLPTNSISGAATQFDFGPFFQYGGTLLGLYRWTIDAGVGADDYLVAISTAGDAVVFQGTDPASPGAFSLRGTWFLGGVPVGKRVAISHGGDLVVLTNFGLVGLSSLVTGVLVTPDTYETKKIRPFFMEAMISSATIRGWQLMWHPEDNFLIVNIPLVPGNPQEQLAMSSAKKGWARLRGLDILCMEVWNRQLYYGTRDGRVMKNTGFVDGVQLNGVTTNATAVECTVLGAFNGLGSANLKMVRLAQLFFITHGVNPAAELLLRYDYDISEPTGALSQGPAASGAWDGGLWDVALWGGGPGTFNPIIGGTGIGRAVAVGAHFFSNDYTVLTGWIVHWETGGML